MPVQTQRPPGASSEFTVAARLSRSVSTTSTSHGVTTVSKLPGANGGCFASPNTRCSPGSARAGADSVRSRAWLARSRGATGNSYRSTRSAAYMRRATAISNGLMSTRDGQRGTQGRVQVVREPPRSAAEHQQPVHGRAAKRTTDGLTCGTVLVVAPVPVAVDVGVIARETLGRCDDRSQRRIRRGGRGLGFGLERRQQRLQAPRMIGARHGQQLEPVACRGARDLWTQRGAVLRCLPLEVGRHRVQAPAPLGQRECGLGQQPRHAVDQGIAGTARGATQRGVALEHAGAAWTAQERQQVTRYRCVQGTS